MVQAGSGELAAGMNEFKSQLRTEIVRGVQKLNGKLGKFNENEKVKFSEN